jgi:uncharacterized membrane protein YhhN
MNNRAFLFIFLLVAVVEIAIQILNLAEFNVFVKPLIVVSLAALYYQNSKLKSNIFLLALFFCWLGDIFLLFDQFGEIYFMAGLGSFLVAHILLIFLYGKLKMQHGDGFSGPQKARVSFPIILAITGLISVLYPNLGALKIPVIIYALALMVMVLQSVYRFGFTSLQSFWNVVAGALLFMLSDSILAINKFYQPLANADVLVIATYMAALFFIVKGVILHSVEKNLSGGNSLL